MCLHVPYDEAFGGGKLVVLKYDLGLMDYLSPGLACGSMPCFISIVPHAPSNCVNELKQFFPHVLYKNEVPDKVYKLPVACASTT